MSPPIGNQTSVPRDLVTDHLAPLDQQQLKLNTNMKMKEPPSGENLRGANAGVTLHPGLKGREFQDPIPNKTPPKDEGKGYSAPKDPAVIKLEDEIAFMTQLEGGDFDRLEAKFKGGDIHPDGKLSKQDVAWAADNTEIPQALRDVAKRMVNDPRLFNIIDKNNDGLITRDEILACITDLKGKLSIANGALSSAPPAQVGATASTAAAATATDGPKVTVPNTNFPPITPSRQSGIEGAIENLSSTANSVQDQITTLTNQLTGDTKADQAVASKIAQLNTKLQMLMNLQSSLITMMSNIAKLWSETSMNAIRNMK